MDPDIERLREKIDELSLQILSAANARVSAAMTIARRKRKLGMPIRDRLREEQLLDRLAGANLGPMRDADVRRLFQAIIDRCVALSSGKRGDDLKVAASGGPVVQLEVRGHVLGRGCAEYVAGPCAVEDELQMERVASGLAARGVRFLRGGCFKPRTSPYAFQGLGEAGLRLLEGAARRHDLVTISEATSPENVELVARHADVIQIGSRNMANFELLRAAGRIQKPVLLKRGFAASLGEWILAAEYVAHAGGDTIVMCERGIRTFADETRNTLDLGIVPLALQKTRLPVIVDVSHAAGRRDILAPLAAAAFGSGASAVMVEVHPDPDSARSDAQQQIDLDAFDRLRDEVVAVFSRTAQRLAARRPSPMTEQEPDHATQRSV